MMNLTTWQYLSFFLLFLPYTCRKRLNNDNEFNFLIPVLAASKFPFKTSETDIKGGEKRNCWHKSPFYCVVFLFCLFLFHSYVIIIFVVPLTLVADFYFILALSHFCECECGFVLIPRLFAFESICVFFFSFSFFDPLCLPLENVSLPLLHRYVFLDGKNKDWFWVYFCTFLVRKKRV